MSKIVQSDGSFGFQLGNLGKKALSIVDITRNNLPGLVSNIASNAKNNLERKISGKGAVRAGKGFPLFIQNEDMNDIIKIVKLLGDSGILIDGITETVKHEMKSKKVNFLVLYQHLWLLHWNNL